MTDNVRELVEAVDALCTSFADSAHAPFDMYLEGTYKETRAHLLALLDSQQRTIEGPRKERAPVLNEIAAERQRQIEVEGWSPAHDDDQHDSGQMARAAGCYALGSDHLPCNQERVENAPAVYGSIIGGPFVRLIPEAWPWDRMWWKPKNPRRDLIRAAALIVAEIERLDRAALAQSSQAGE